jgi:hypothetical protein
MCRGGEALTRVADLAHQLAVAPQAQLAAAPTVANRVRHDLVDRDEEDARAIGRQPGRFGRSTDLTTHRCGPFRVESRRVHERMPVQLCHPVVDTRIRRIITAT